MEQYILFDELEKKEARALALFRLFEDTAVSYHPAGYYLAFSGGKDSVVIYCPGEDGRRSVPGPLSYNNRRSSGAGSVYPKQFPGGLHGCSGIFHVEPDCEEADSSGQNSQVLL